MKKTPRNPKDESEYTRWKAENKGETCAFCNLPNWQIIKKYNNFIVAKNRFPYKDWFGHKIINHIMIIPNKHIEWFDEFLKTEINEYIKIISEYERKGYSSHTKTKLDPTRSITHFHTHLFKIVDNQ